MHHVVQLDGPLQLPPLNFPHTFTKHAQTTPSDLPSRLSTATIVIAAATKIPRQAILTQAPNVQLYAWLGAGTDNIDAEAVREKGNVTLTNTPAQNTVTVAEHAIALYFGVKRKVVELDGFVREGRWRDGYPVGEFGGMPRVCEDEVVGIVGYGALGQRVGKLCKALDMPVLIAERKSSPTTTRQNRTPFTTVLTKSTLLFILCPLDPSTKNMLSTPELALLGPTTIIINVARGGVVNETALASALRRGTLGGAGIDVFETEPATGDTSPLLEDGVPNLVVSPHLAWFSARTVEGTKEMVKGTIEAFVRGRPVNVVVGPGEGGRKDREV